MKFVQPNIVFLDNDLKKSAQYLTNKFLLYNLKHCCQVLVCYLLYNVGIRNKKICKFYFCKERKTESLNKFFPNWPLKNAPSFTLYNSQEAKWCRKCKNHYDIIFNYYEQLLNEADFRGLNTNEHRDMLEFLRMAPYELSLRLGIHIVYIQNLKIILPWKNLPLRFRKKDIIEGYRKYYRDELIDPFLEYQDSKRNIPDFIVKNYDVEEMQTNAF